MLSVVLSVEVNIDHRRDLLWYRFAITLRDPRPRQPSAPLLPRHLASLMSIRRMQVCSYFPSTGSERRFRENVRLLRARHGARWLRIQRYSGCRILPPPGLAQEPVIIDAPEDGHMSDVLRSADRLPQYDRLAQAPAVGRVTAHRVNAIGADALPRWGSEGRRWRSREDSNFRPTV